jgi:hypothetical protein
MLSDAPPTFVAKLHEPTSTPFITLRSVMIIHFDLELGPVIVGQAPRPEHSHGYFGRIQENFERLSGLFMAQENGKLGNNTSYVYEEHSDVIFLFHAVDLTADHYPRYHFRFTPAFAFSLREVSDCCPTPTLDELETALTQWTAALEALRNDLVTKERTVHALSVVVNAPSNPTIAVVNTYLQRHPIMKGVVSTPALFTSSPSGSSSTPVAPPPPTQLVTPPVAVVRIAEPAAADRLSVSPDTGVTEPRGETVIARKSMFSTSMPLSELAQSTIVSDSDMAQSQTVTLQEPEMPRGDFTPATNAPGKQPLVSFDLPYSNAFDEIDDSAAKLITDTLQPMTPLLFSDAAIIISPNGLAPRFPTTLNDVLQGIYDGLTEGQKHFVYPSGDVVSLALVPVRAQPRCATCDDLDSALSHAAEAKVWPWRDFDVPLVTVRPDEVYRSLTSAVSDLALFDVWRSVDGVRSVFGISNLLGLQCSVVHEALYQLAQAYCVWMTPALPDDEPTVGPLAIFAADAPSPFGVPTTPYESMAAVISAFRAMPMFQQRVPPPALRATPYFYREVFMNVQHPHHGELAMFILSLWRGREAEEERLAGGDAASRRSESLLSQSPYLPVEAATVFCWDVIPLFDQVPCGSSATVIHIVDEALALLTAAARAYAPSIAGGSSVTSSFGETPPHVSAADLRAAASADDASDYSDRASRAYLADGTLHTSEMLATVANLDVLDTISLFGVALIRFACVYGWLAIEDKA